MKKRFSEQDLSNMGLVKQADGSYKKTGAAKIISDPVPVINLKVNKIKNTFVEGKMNKWEQSYKLHLQNLQMTGEISWFMFEAFSFRLAGGTWYRPDFIVVTADGKMQVHEVKGRWQDDAR